MQPSQHDGLGCAGTYSSLASVTVIGTPGAPAIGAAAATGQTTATVAFTAPTLTGGSPITTYTATSDPAGGTGTSPAAGSITVNGLTAGTAYTFTMKATNMYGDSVNSAGKTFTASS